MAPSVSCYRSGADAVGLVVKELSRKSPSGYLVQALAVDDPALADEPLLALDVPVVPLDQAITVMRETMSDSIIVAGGRSVGADFVRSLSWELDQSQSLILTPVMLDVAGPRVSTRPVAGLNLVHVDLPRFTGAGAVVKRGLDVLLAGVGLLVLALPLGVLAVWIKLDSKGPVFYSQERVGLRGDRFRIWKFRSMVADADKKLDELAELRAVRQADDQFAGNEVLFKLKDDPRVTRVGRWMRRFSIDELCRGVVT